MMKTKGSKDYIKFLKESRKFPVKKYYYLSHFGELRDEQKDNVESFVCENPSQIFLINEIEPDLVKEGLMFDKSLIIKVPERGWGGENFYVCKAFKENNLKPNWFFFDVHTGGDICDYGDVEWMDNGFIHYEHGCYYPEYVYALEMEWGIDGNYNSARQQYENTASDWHNIDDFIENDPCYGRIVNSMCWSASYYSLSHFLECPARYTLACDLEVKLYCWVNTKFNKYSPKSIVDVVIPINEKDIPDAKNKEYDFWMKLQKVFPSGKKISVDCFYPKKYSYNQSIKILTKQEECEPKYITWIHGKYGLSKEIISNYNLR